MLFTLACATIWFLAVSLLILGTRLAAVHFGRPRTSNNSTKTFQPISILKPVKGREEGLERNLVAFFCLDYPKYEIIFSVADPNDPAVSLIEHLIEAHPRCDARLVLGDEPVGPNPKVNNLVRPYREASYDWILVSDSNCLIASDDLKTLASEFSENVGIITGVVRGTYADSFGGLLEAVFLNTFFARWMILTAYFGQECVVGKCMFFRKSTAERFGGIHQLGKFLAEDYMAGQAIKMLGLKVHLFSRPVRQPLTGHSVGAFWNRHVRWGRIRKAQAPLPVAFEPLLGSVLSGLAGAYAASHLFGISNQLFLFMHAGLWFAADIYLSELLGEEVTPEYALTWIAREAIALPLWLYMIAGNTVNWRGHKLRVKPGGTLEGA